METNAPCLILGGDVIDPTFDNSSHDTDIEALIAKYTKHDLVQVESVE